MTDSESFDVLEPRLRAKALALLGLPQAEALWETVHGGSVRDLLAFLGQSGSGSASISRSSA